MKKRRVAVTESTNIGGGGGGGGVGVFISTCWGPKVSHRKSKCAQPAGW